MTNDESTQTRKFQLYPDAKTLTRLNLAAWMKGLSIEEFVFAAARDAAEDAATLIEVSPETYEWFENRLNAPLEPNERLKRLMQTPAPWEES